MPNLNMPALRDREILPIRGKLNIPNGFFEIEFCKNHASEEIDEERVPLNIN